MAKILIYTKGYIAVGCVCDIFEYWKGFCMKISIPIELHDWIGVLCSAALYTVAAIIISMYVCMYKNVNICMYVYIGMCL